MKLISKFKSKNFDSRKLKDISYIIIHYTALNNIDEAIKFLCNPSKKVSCHYLISKDGKIYNLVHDKKRAWHAGKSYWQGNHDMNSRSIGIELDFNPKINKRFNAILIKSLINLTMRLKKKYNIDDKNILGHSDVAPYRKIDPGKHFPWIQFANLGIVFFPRPIKKKYIKMIEDWFKKIGFYSQKNKILFMLSYIGYEIEPSLKNNYNYKKLIDAYFSHYGKKRNLNKNKYNLIRSHFLNQFLTF